MSSLQFDVTLLDLYSATVLNQSVENVGVAFVKGANERNESFEKKQTNSNV